MEWTLAVVALALIAVGALSRRIDGTSVTPAIIFVGIGLIAGTQALDLVEVPPTGDVVKVLAEATLTVVLFADAARIDLPTLRREFNVPARLLGIGLPLTIALGALLAAAFFSALSLAEALVLAVLLAPTDAALGQAVVTEPKLPSRIRQGLNVESGLNDGICVPLLFIVLAIAEADAGDFGAAHAVRLVVEEIGWGTVGGVLAGIVAAAAVVYGSRYNLIEAAWLQIMPVAGAALAYGFAAPLGGSGFIAAFVAGMTFAVLSRPVKDVELTFLSDELGELLNGVTLLVFGAVLLWPALDGLTWRIALYSLASLTVIRMLPVAIAMLGTGARQPTVAFLGWFGPRGLASIVFAVIVVQEADLPHAGTILLTTYATVGLSVLAHGVTAAPLARRYATWFASTPRDASVAMESVPAGEHRWRWRSGTVGTDGSSRGSRPV
jgi:sodium/hydrogen antiporter